jgi:iron complex transport system ATP-binding protein
MSLSLKNLTIGYVGRHHTHVVQRNINAEIHSGQLTCLLGANGIGKSTLLRTLAAFQPALEGEVWLNDKRIDQLTPNELSQLISVVLTEKPDLQNMTVRELVAMGRAPYTGFWGRLTAEDEDMVTTAISQVGITSLERRYVSTLSDGERQKVMIAKALAQQTPVIYLDEPTAFLDFPSKVEMMQLLRRLAHQMQKTVFLSTHDFELALQVADVLWLMEPQSLHIGTARQLADSGVLSRFVEREGIAFDAHHMRVYIK